MLKFTQCYLVKLSTTLNSSLLTCYVTVLNVQYHHDWPLVPVCPPPAAHSWAAQTLGHSGCSAGGSECPWDQGDHFRERTEGGFRGRWAYYLHSKSEMIPLTHTHTLAVCLSGHCKVFTNNNSAYKNVKKNQFLGYCHTVKKKKIHFLLQTFCNVKYCCVLEVVQNNWISRWWFFYHLYLWFPYFHHMCNTVTVIQNIISRPWVQK